MPDELVQLMVASAWKTLYEAAKVRHFEPIMKLASDDMNKVPDILYHSSCRSDFTHKKSLAKLTDPNHATDEQKDEQPRQSKRQRTSDTSSRVYDKNCIFCEKHSKYTKGLKTCKRLIQALDLRADTRI